jgi:hypothetical protein
VVSTAGKISFDSGTLGANNHDRLVVASLTLANTALEIYDRTNSSLTPGTSLTYVTKNTGGLITTPFTAVAENAVLSLSNHVFLATYAGGSGNDFALTPFVHSTAPATASQLNTLAGGGFQFGANGSNGVLYALVTATNLTLPATNWTTLTNVFPSAGLIRVKLTNSVAKPQQWRNPLKNLRNSRRPAASPAL